MWILTQNRLSISQTGCRFENTKNGLLNTCTDFLSTSRYIDCTYIYMYTHIYTCTYTYIYIERIYIYIYYIYDILLMEVYPWGRSPPHPTSPHAGAAAEGAWGKGGGIHVGYVSILGIFPCWISIDIHIYIYIYMQLCQTK